MNFLNYFCRLSLWGLFLVIILGSTATGLKAEPDVRTNHKLLNGDSTYEYISPILKAEQNFTGVITEWNLPNASEQAEHEAFVYFRNLEINKDWSEWTPLISDSGHDRNSHTNDYSTLLTVNPSAEYQYKVVLSEEFSELNELNFEFLSIPGNDELVSSHSYLVAGLNPSPLLEVIPRSTWGAKDEYNYADVSIDDSIDADAANTQAGKTDSQGETDPDIERVIDRENGHELLWPYQYAEEIRYMVVHHTVTGSDNPQQSLRNIQYYHAVSRGWGDIGYNYIIDQQGRIYEGRKGGEKVIGGHSIPVNKTSIGVAVLGNFQTDTPPPAVLDALSRLITQKVDLHNLSPEGNDIYKDHSYPVVGGHRDSDATACPGDYLYDSLPTVRHMVKQSLASLQGITPEIEDLDPIRSITEIDAQSSDEIEIRVRNNTDETWNYNNSYLALFNRGGINFDLEVRAPVNLTSKVGPLKTNRNVEPGDVATFVVKVDTGLRGGFVSLALTPVINSMVKSDAKVFVPIYAQDSIFQFELSGMSNPYTLTGEASDTKLISFKLTNRSNFTWNSNSETQVLLGVDSPRDQNPELVRVSSSSLSDGRIWKLGKELAPGQSVSVSLTTEIPQGYGTFSETYRPVINGFGWADGAPLNLKYSLKPPITAPRGKVDSFLDRFLGLAQFLDLDSSRADLPSSGVDTKDLRVNLSAFKEDSTEVRVNSNYKLYVNNKLYRLVRRFDEIKVAQDGSSIGVFVNDIYYSGTEVRLEPFSRSEGIVTLVDMEQRPGWNKDLNDNTFRDTIEFRLDGGELIAINEIPLGYYLLGVAETSNGANSELQKTMNILARTYAAYYLEPAHTKFKGKPYDLDDSPARSQRYLGYGFELRSPKAISSFKKVNNYVVTLNDELVITPYFSRSDGRTKSAKEVWGWDWAPHLQSVPDTYCADSDTKPAAGHGVGLSGCGAAGLANSGKDHEEIIKYFYQGVEVNAY